MESSFLGSICERTPVKTVRWGGYIEGLTSYMLNIKAISMALKPRSAACSKTINRRAPSVTVYPLYDIAAVYRLRIGAGCDSAATTRGGDGHPIIAPSPLSSAMLLSMPGILCTPSTAWQDDVRDATLFSCKAVASCVVDILSMIDSHRQYTIKWLACASSDSQR